MPADPAVCAGVKFPGPQRYASPLTPFGSPIAFVPTQVDYSDYRDVNGVKMPYKWTLTWVNGRDNYELSELRPNVAVDAAKFAKPAPPKAPR